MVAEFTNLFVFIASRLFLLAFIDLIYTAVFFLSKLLSHSLYFIFKGFFVLFMFSTEGDALIWMLFS